MKESNYNYKNNKEKRRKKVLKSQNRKKSHFNKKLTKSYKKRAKNKTRVN